MNKLKYFLLPSLYLFIGTFITIELLKIILHYSSVGYLVLLIPMSMLTVLLTVIGIVNAWVQYRMLRENILIRSYDYKEMLWLYLKCWLVLISGITLVVVFYWFHDLLPESIQGLIHNLYILFYVICGFLTFSALLSVILRENLNEIKLLNAENENQLLKGQLNPHFLYNTLNNIDALVWIDQERASQAVTTLSDLMRYLTYSSKQEKISIGEEIRHLQQLIELQRLRVNNVDAIKFDINVDDDNVLIAPLMMIPLVENCFKHCGNIDEDNAVLISINIKDRRLIFNTDNNLRDEDSQKKDKKKGGVGLVVLRRRLSLLYPNRYTLFSESKNGRYSTILDIKL